MIPKAFSLLILVSISFRYANSQSYEDKRCKCICPSVKDVVNTTDQDSRKIFIANVPPNKCNCDGVVLPHLEEHIKGKELEFCPRCECKYEARNTGIINVVVTIILVIISVLVIYMLFLTLLDPLVNKRLKMNYTEHTNEDCDENGSIAPGQINLSMPSRNDGGNVLNRVGQHQDKWKQQVKEQRRNIYDRHSMLN